MGHHPLERVEAMPVGTRDVSVDGEWSLVETLRHLVLATDCWLGTAIQRRDDAFHPLGLLFTEFAGREADYGLDVAARPSYREVLDARNDRVVMVRQYLDEVTPDQLTEIRADPWGSPWEPTVLDCMLVIFNEEWQHHRYIARDLDSLAAGDS